MKALKLILGCILFISSSLFGQSSETIYSSNELTFGHTDYNDIITKVIKDGDRYITLGSIYTEGKFKMDIKVFENDTLIEQKSIAIYNSVEQFYLVNTTINYGLVDNNNLYICGEAMDPTNSSVISFLWKFEDIEDLSNYMQTYKYNSDFNRFSSITKLNNGNILVCGSNSVVVNSEQEIWWNYRIYNENLSLVKEINNQRVPGTGNLVEHHSINAFQLNNGNIAHFGTGSRENGDTYSYYNLFDDTLGNRVDISLSFNDEHEIHDVIKVNESGEERFFTTGTTIDGSYLMLSICSFDSQGNTIFNENHNLGSNELGKSITLTDDNCLLITGRVKEVEEGYNGSGAYLFYGDEYGGDSYNAFVHKVSATNAATQWTFVYGSERHEVANDLVILDNKQIVIVGNQQSYDGIDLENNEDFYLDQYIINLNIQGCTNDVASNYSNLLANFNDGTCLYSESTFQNLHDNIDLGTDSIFELNTTVIQNNLLIDSLVFSSDSLSIELISSQSTILELQTNLSSTLDSVTTLNNSLQDCSEDAFNLNSYGNSLSSELSISQNTIIELQVNLSSTLDSVTSLNNNLLGCSEEAFNMNVYGDSLSVELISSQNTILELQTNLSSTLDSVTTLNNSLQDCSEEAFNLNNYGDSLSTELMSSQNTILELQTNLSSTIDSVEILNNDLFGCSIEINTLNSELDSLIGESDMTNNFINQQNEYVDELVDSLLGLNNEIISLSYEHLLFIDQINSLSTPIQIDLLEGWNIIGYTLQIPQDAAATFMEIVNEIIIVKDNAADVYWPEFSFNGIGDLIPGQGYQIKVNSSIDGFTYPNTNGERIELSPTVPQWVIDMETQIHPNDIRTLVKIVNMLGQEVNSNKQPTGTTLLYLYNDGTVEKKIIFHK
jgi:hypothetical protein